LNTVIGKMSRVVEDPEEISALDLTPITPELPRALLVEEFNQIEVTQSHLPGFMPGLRVFQEKADLLPFEEAKLYGHNAVHALMGYLAELRGYERLADLAGDDTIMSLAEQAILQESGAALRRKYADLDDPLFTEEGFRRYATDLLTRITNPFLADRTDRVIRNPLRKLQAKDRLFGTMSLAIDQGIEPVTMALGSLAALHYLVSGEADVEIPVSLPLAPQDIAPLLNWVWSGEPPRHRDHVLSLLQAAWPAAEKLRIP